MSLLGTAVVLVIQFLEPRPARMIEAVLRLPRPADEPEALQHAVSIIEQVRIHRESLNAKRSVGALGETVGEGQPASALRESV